MPCPQYVPRSAWCAKYRLPDGRQVEKKLGPAWTERGRPPAGYCTKRLAEDWLREVLDQARRGTLPGMVRTGATFADAAAEYLRYIEHDRGRKPSTLPGYRSAITAHRLPAFGSLAVEDVTADVIARRLAGFDGSVRQKYPAIRSGDIQAFSPEEIWSLVRAAASDQDRAIYLTAAFTGLRMGELLALR